MWAEMPPTPAIFLGIECERGVENFIQWQSEPDS